MISDTNSADRLVLRPRRYLEPGRRRMIVQAVGMVLAVTIVGLLLSRHLGPIGDIDGLAAVPGAVSRAVLRDPVLTVFVALLIVRWCFQLVSNSMARRNERVILTSAGIEYVSPWPAALRFMQPGWSLRWDALESVVVEGGLSSGPRELALGLKSGDSEHRVYPYQWADPARFVPEAARLELRRGAPHRAEDVLAVMRDAEILRSLQAYAPRFDPMSAAELQPRMFAIDRNRRAVTVLLGFAALVLYTVVDLLLQSQPGHTDAVSSALYAWIGVGAGVVVWAWMRLGKVPAAEALLIALMFGFALTGACHPAGSRLGLAAGTVAPGLPAPVIRVTVW